MTLSTSEVAVCCCNGSLRSSVRCRNSLSSRAFSMAMTAWSAKVVTSSICFSVNARTDLRCKVMTPIGVPSLIKGTPRKIVRVPLNFSPADRCIRDRPGYPRFVCSLPSIKARPTAVPRSVAGRVRREVLVKFPRAAECRLVLVNHTLWPRQSSDVSFAKPSRQLHEHVQHGLQIESRATDNLEHIGHGESAAPAIRPNRRCARVIHLADERSLDGDHGLVSVCL